MANLTTTIVGSESASIPHLIVGKYVGDGAASAVVNVGFVPTAMLALNWTDGDVVWFWSKDDVANVMTLVDSGVGTTDISKQAIAVTQTTASNSVYGVILPANAVINESGKTYYFLAFR